MTSSDMPKRDSEETIDESFIPLLDEVINPQDLAAHPPLQVGGVDRDEDQKTLLGVLREGITAQLSHDLRPIVAIAVTHALDQVTAQIRQALREELNDALEERLRQIIEAEVTREIKKIRT